MLKFGFGTIIHLYMLYLTVTIEARHEPLMPNNNPAKTLIKRSLIENHLLSKRQSNSQSGLEKLGNLASQLEGLIRTAQGTLAKSGLQVNIDVEERHPPPPPEDFRGPGGFRGPPPHHRGGPPGYWGGPPPPPPPHEGPGHRGPPPEFGGPPPGHRGPPPGHRGPPPDHRGPPHEHRGPPPPNEGPGWYPPPHSRPPHGHRWPPGRGRPPPGFGRPPPDFGGYSEVNNYDYYDQPSMEFVPASGEQNTGVLNEEVTSTTEGFGQGNTGIVLGNGKTSGETSNIVGYIEKNFPVILLDPENEIRR